MNFKKFFLKALDFFTFHLNACNDLDLRSYISFKIVDIRVCKLECLGSKLAVDVPVKFSVFPFKVTN